MPDLIRLDPGPATGLAPGVIALDEAGRTLHFTTNQGDVTLPLDRMALAERDENAGSEVYVWRDGGVAEIVEFDAGGGGQERDDATWRVLGLMPISLAGEAVAATHEALFEVSDPLTIANVRVRVNGAADIIITIETLEGTEMEVIEDTVASGGNILASGVTLDPGRYRMVVEVSDALTFDAVTGYLSWGEEATHVVMVEVA